MCIRDRLYITPVGGREQQFVGNLIVLNNVTRFKELDSAKTKALNEEGLTAYCLTGAYDIPSPTVTGSLKDESAECGMTVSRSTLPRLHF